MELLEQLRRANPGLPLFDVRDPEFTPYGRVLDFETTALDAAMRATPLPETGNRYVASLPELEALPLRRELAERVFGGMEVQAGTCNGHGHLLNALEYHKCSEVNYSSRGLVLLLALPSQLKDGRLDARDVVGFCLPPQVMIEIHPLVLHFAPCRVLEEGFDCLVVLERGTNAPLGRVDTTAPGEQKLLWMRNKWLTCHPDSPQAKNGAFVGISGDNLDLRLP
ncbi:MAG: DUF4867 family protein [Oscillospiraceae bacterium]|nr:DUF4867 family protein [Oscillospiraceae bacterium]